MLDRLELFLVTAKIRKYCTLDSISSVSRENTTIQLAHADCDALIVNGRCTKCEVLAQADCTVWYVEKFQTSSAKLLLVDSLLSV